MLYLILLFLVVLFYAGFNRILQSHLDGERTDCEQLKQDYAALIGREAVLKANNDSLLQQAESIIERYEITKDVCRSMDVDTVFEIFEERLRHYIKFDRLRLIKQDLDYQLYQDQLIFPLDIGIKPTFFLVAEGVPEKDQEQFYILTQQFLLGYRRATLYQRIQDLAIHDGLTSILTRRYFMERLEEEIERARKFNLRFSFLMVDVDFFKRCNDNYGHLVGDAVLKEIAGVIKDNARQVDIVGRYGGEEFAVILSEISKENAFSASLRFLKSVEDKRIKAYDEELNLTVSIGISSFPEDGKQMQELIDKADLALYQAKQSGRNQICIYQPSR
jgi:diguanylate cyclase (GGDEF)-like protein